MKFLIAGLGSIGRRHLQNLLALGERDILLYRSGNSSQQAEDHKEFPVETDLKAALAHRPDAVIISNPTVFHLDVAIPAAGAGCHLLLEKPISHNLEHLDELRAAVERGGGQVLVGYQFRFHPGLQQISNLLTSEILGRPLFVRAHWGEWLPAWHPWEDYRQGYSARSDLGGGVILTLSHPLDYLRWLFGEVSAVWAFVGRLSNLEIDVEDTAEIGLQFENEMIGSVHLDYNQRPSAHTLQITGTQGSLLWDNGDGAVRLYREEIQTLPSSSRPEVGMATGYQGGMKGDTYPAPPGFQRNDLFRAEMLHFLNVIRGQEAPLCTLEDGIQALRLGLAAYRSAEKGQLVKL